MCGRCTGYATKYNGVAYNTRSSNGDSESDECNTKDSASVCFNSATATPACAGCQCCPSDTECIITDGIAQCLDPCVSYSILNDTWRSINNTDTSITHCDQYIAWNGWYRFYLGQSNAQIPERCVKEHRCGTHAPLWLNGTHPVQFNEIVTRTVCNAWSSSCCVFPTHTIQIKRCYGYYVYKLEKPSACHLAYCADEVTVTGGVTTPNANEAITPVTDPCEQLHCAEYERCGKKDGVYGCFCDEDHHRPNTKSYDSNITCSSSSGIMSISRCQLFEAGFHSSALHLRDESCTGTIQDGRLVFHFDNDDHLCGTTLRSNGSHFMYENSIQGDVDTHGGVISRQRNLNLRFCCVYPLEQALSMSVGISSLESIVDKKLPFGTGSYRMRMTPYEDEAFLTPFSTNENIGLEINNMLYVEVRTEGVDQRQLSTVLESCWATPVNDADYPVRWDLIDSQCPNPADGTVEVIKNGVSTAARFSFRMFTFTNYTEIYLHCNVHLCLLTNNCTADCSPGHQNRRRRDVSYHDSGSLSLGPLAFGAKQTTGALIYRNGASDHLTSIVTLIVSLLMTRIWAN
ncbi:pancreatic secretory granule membrane major glycoprotein GP2 [Fundulus heteroclitus]|uniref:pancreatic secretory granule membrane major glycoprotein GP2 n=1 Tax=Fundulus heteroclitus TaxID=8078 RepID=UPI00165ABFA3|nr:pancreatic secretory granule membrane major glycoprotein GP2 [Fundulus heteroclitus]